MEIVRDAQIAAISYTTAAFGSGAWTQIDLSSMTSLTAASPGSDIASIMIENTSSSTGAAHIFFTADPGEVTAATDGFEIAVGAVMGEDRIAGLRYISVRAATNSGTVKVVLRSYRTSDQAPWE